MKKHTALFLFLVGLAAFYFYPKVRAEAAAGPLRVLSSNPRYFTDGTGKAVYLTGSHERNNLQITVSEVKLSSFDYNGYLNILAENNHNFIRLWAWEDTDHSPVIYKRTGPGAALDGGAKFDLNQFNQEYFDRLRSRVIAARDRGIYVSVMLFAGWSVGAKPEDYNKWPEHPFNKSNNIQRINGDPDGDGSGYETHELEVAEITELQKAYIRKVVDTVNDLDNVLYEISNESHGASEEWQYEMIRYVKTYEASKPKRHPVGMTVEWPDPSNADLFNSTADWISPHADGGRGNYRDDPPANDGRKIIINDTDHLIANGVELEFVWKSFTRGLHPIIIDGRLNGLNLPIDANARAAMGHTRAYADKMNLASMTPQPALTSTSYALANPGSEYIVYQPGGSPFTVDLSAGAYSYEWFNVDSGAVWQTGDVNAPGGWQIFTPPFSGQAVLHLKSK